MAVTPKLEIKQSQSLLMTPQLRQAISILQMNNLELSTAIENELNNNPLLEREEDVVKDIENQKDEQSIDDYDSVTNTTEIEEENFTPDVEIDNSFDDSDSDREGYTTNDGTSWQDYLAGKSKSSNPDEEYDYFEQRLAHEKSLYEIIEEQISLNFSHAAERIIAHRLLEQLDASGYFLGSVTAIAQNLGAQETRVEEILQRMKGFEPSGIFAQSLKECIKIQLEDQNQYDKTMAVLLENLELLGSKDYKTLKKKTNIDDETLAELIKKIRGTNPKPATIYSTVKPTYIIPDVRVTKTRFGNYQVELNYDSLPRVLINQRYLSEIKKQSPNNKQTQKYLKTQLNSANFLVKAMHQRATTILKVAEAIVNAQYDFFEHGIDYLKPLSLKDIADAAELHESTISRVTNNKYMATPRGLFELKYFFSGGALSYKGEENTSTTAIKHKIKNWIENETPQKILSDDNISEKLAIEGIKVARRTVAKYREQMGIATSSERKRNKRQILSPSK